LPGMKGFKRVYNIVTTILLILALILAFLLVGLRLFGFKPYTVLSGSMEPTYHVGSMIYVKDVPPDSLQVRDPVTYRNESGKVVTHRVIEVYNEPGQGVSYRTKGDANDTADGILTPDRVIGKPIFSIPYLGYVANYIQSPSGMMLAVCVCLVLMVGMFVPEILSIMLEKPQIQSENSEQSDSAKQTDVASTKSEDGTDQNV